MKILHRVTGECIWESNHATMREVVEAAVQNGAVLSGADLRGCDLRGAKGVNKAATSPMYLLRDQVGPIRLYKLVGATGESPISRVTITYEVGKSYEVNDANTDETESCGAGINVASLDWCIREWRRGWRVLLVEFQPEDIACIPIGSDGKVRLHRCTVVRELDPSEYLAEVE